MTDWKTLMQRDDLKACPFCNTRAIQQINAAKIQHRISCGNPFCELDCRTQPFADVDSAVAAWQERAADIAVLGEVA
jgi:hypothetical protein